jgi:hypothetical protein
MLYQLTTLFRKCGNFSITWGERRHPFVRRQERYDGATAAYRRRIT